VDASGAKGQQDGRKPTGDRARWLSEVLRQRTLPSDARPAPTDLQLLRGGAEVLRGQGEAVDNPHLRLNLDLYHAQIGEGNLVQLVERALPYVGEIQVADVPGRCEPGTGEINYQAVAAALQRLGYTGVVGLEGWAADDPVQALERFRTAFTVN